MAKVYSYQFFAGAAGGMTTELIFTVPENQTAVIRESLYTVEDVFGDPTLSLQLAEDGPGWQLRDELLSKRIILGALTFNWKGHLVFAPGQEIWMNTNYGGAVVISGYLLGP